tara:strand:- start:21184 stop:21843 length:660 start_codon:yes stop_codon:yes gene_type:complete
MFSKEDRYHISNCSEKEWHNLITELFDDTGLDEQNATEALFKVDDCLKQKGLKYWLCYGTALGFYRDGNFIPWDDDIDIHTIASDYEAVFDEIKDLFIENGFIVRAVKRDVSSKMSLFYKKIKIQIQGIYETEDEPGMIQTKLFKYPKQFYYDKAEKYNYKGRVFLLPGPASEYLTFCYDKNWNIPQNIPDWRDYMNIEQLKNAHWIAAHIQRSGGKKK